MNVQDGREIQRHPAADGIVPGGMSRQTRCRRMGRTGQAHEGASNADPRTGKPGDIMCFMFEARFPRHLAPRAAAGEAPLRNDHVDVRADMKVDFNSTPEGTW